MKSDLGIWFFLWFTLLQGAVVWKLAGIRFKSRQSHERINARLGGHHG